MPRVSAYYFRAHMYTLVPEHVRHDLDWMAAHGTDAVILGVLEQDVFAAVENIQFVCEEANRRGMQVYATPSRWGNLVAGCPKVPSLFTATHLDCWAMHEDGTPYMSFLGPLASVHHPHTWSAMSGLIKQVLDMAPISGIIWDELKCLHVRDYSPAAREALGEAVHDEAEQVRAQIDFFGKLNAFAKAQKPDVLTTCFLYANMKQARLEAVADMQALDEFGCDGRPWDVTDGGSSDDGGAVSKCLLSEGERFIRAARERGLRSYALIENHAMRVADHPLLDSGLSRLREMDFDHLTYYYYPRSCEDVEASMQIIGSQIKRLR